MTETEADAQAARLAAFCSARAPAVFESIVHSQELWTPDPFDVFEIHSEAREQFTRMLDRASATPSPKSGKVLLLKGEAGSGKTHLMRAFRKLTHESRQGYFGYLQMSVKYDNYGRYLLGRVIDSLSQPYFPPEVAASGLARLSTWVFDAIPGVTDEERQDFRDGGGDDVCRLVFEYADRALSDPRLQDCDADLMRALLFLQRGVPSLKEKATRWLRCQDLSKYDRDALGGMVPRTRDEDPIRIVAQLGKLMALVEGAALVICIDQLDDMIRDSAPIKQFPEAVDALVSLLDEVPSVVIVVACIEDYFAKGRPTLAKPKLDRLEHDPEPIRLANSRDLDEIEPLLARRLEHLYDEAGVDADPTNPIFPFRPEQLKPLVHLSTREVLNHLRLHQQRCILEGAWVAPDWNQSGPGPATEEYKFDELWNDFQAHFKESVPEDEAGRAKLLVSAIQRCNDELPAGYEFSVASNGRMFPAARHTPENVVERFFIAVCENSPRGGGLGNQVTRARELADGTPLVVVRSTPFPKTARALVVQQLGQIIAAGGRRVEVEDADWRLMQAFGAFAPAHAPNPDFTKWVRASRPMSQLSSLRCVLDLDKLPAPRAVPEAAGGTTPVNETFDPSPAKPSVSEATVTIPEETVKPKVIAPRPATGPLRLGVTRGVIGVPVPLEMSELRQHMAFLGGSGSGKTTAALLILEQLLQRGVPVILVDRKGDLCRYADPTAWTSHDAGVAQRLNALRQQVDVALYTPGASAGRSLRISVVPEGLAQMPTADREQFAEYGAAALAAMMGYNPARRSADKIHQVILAKAIGVLAEASSAGGVVTIETLHGLVDSQDAGLLNATGGYDEKHFRKLAENLLTLKLSSTRLLGAELDERLDINILLGKGASTGKTRLTIISTQALGDPAAIDFWVSQLLVALDRWRAKSPSGVLQAALMLDEADQYLPAIRQPATKAPLESLLRRARSAGLGIFLATQSPGDLDYRCRDQIRNWLVGRVRETVALNKLKPMFADAKIDVAAKLPNQSAGEFILLREGQAIAVKTDLSLMETRQVDDGRILELAARRN
jgi:energy-coupling factor transporter ATP-binding protein EcfA2